MIRKTSNNIVIFGHSITNFGRYDNNTFDQKIEESITKFKYFLGALLRDLLSAYLNPALQKSEFDVAIIHVGFLVF